MGTFELRTELGEEISYGKIWVKGGPGKRNPKYKGPGAGMCLVSLKDSRKAQVAEVE